jgi:hypothetical protein
MVVLGLPRQGSCRSQLPLAISATDAASHPALACCGSMIFSEDHIHFSGGLVSYGPNFPSLYRRAGDFVDKILRGAPSAQTGNRV